MSGCKPTLMRPQTERALFKRALNTSNASPRRALKRALNTSNASPSTRPQTRLQARPRPPQMHPLDAPSNAPSSTWHALNALTRSKISNCFFIVSFHSKLNVGTSACRLGTRCDPPRPFARHRMPTPQSPRERDAMRLLNDETPLMAPPI